MKKYIGTRSAPSAQSVRRVKKEFKQMAFPPHPILEAHKLTMSADFDVLQGLRNYKPSVTIFELNTNSKQAAAEIMKAKRRAHGKYIRNTEKESKLPAEELAERLQDGKASDDEDVETFQDSVKVTKLPSVDSLIPKKKAKKGKYDEQKERDKTEHYISYRAADEDTERGFQMDTNSFDAMAKAASVEIIADDDKGINKNRGLKKWYDVLHH